MIVIPNEGAIELLTKTLIAPLVTDESYSLRLYRNDYTPVAGSTLTSFIEAAFLGYFRYDLARADWGAPTIVDGRAVSVYGGPVIEWTAADGPSTVYGYYVVAPATAKVAWAERFNVPRTLAVGGKLVITAKLTGRGQV